VLVTRAADQAGELVEALRRAGLEPVSVPAIEIESVPPGGALDAAARHLDRYDWVVVTSANGARAILAAARGATRQTADRATRWPTRRTADGATRWAAVGAATRQALEQGGIEVAHQPSRASAAGIAGELPIGAGDRVLLLRGDLADGELPEALRARGADVEDIVAYRTREAPESSRALLRNAIADGPLDLVLFTSGSTVRGLVALAGAEQVAEILSVPAVCIGPETASEAQRAGFAVLAEATTPDATVLAAIAARTVETLTRQRQPQEVR